MANWIVELGAAHGAKKTRRIVADNHADAMEWGARKAASLKKEDWQVISVKEVVSAK
jgi:hypothetical protein